MSCHKKSTPSFLIILFLLGGSLLWAQDEEVNQAGEEELPLEEALALIDEVCPLPSWDEPLEVDPVASLLPIEGEELDYGLLRSLQLEDRIKEAEARVNSREFGNGPIDAEEYFSTRENMFIRDPERYLTTREHRQLTNILTTHAGESSYNLHLNVLGHNDVAVIDSLSEETHIDLLAGDEKGVIIYYFYDAPSRTVTYFSPGAKSIMPKEIRKEITSSAIHEASIQGDYYQAAYRYILDITLKVSNFSEAETEKEELKEPVVLAEIPVPEPVVEKPIKKITNYILGLGIIPLSIFVFGGLGIFLMISIHFWNVNKRTHRYPVADLPDHLGFPRARGCSGVMQFGKNAPSLKAQQDKLFS